MYKKKLNSSEKNVLNKYVTFIKLYYKKYFKLFLIYLKKLN